MFKAGDKVECIKASSIGFPGVVGEIYTVAENSRHYMYLEEFPGKSLEPLRFRLCMQKRESIFKLFRVGSDALVPFTFNTREAAEGYLKNARATGRFYLMECVATLECSTHTVVKEI